MKRPKNPTRQAKTISMILSISKLKTLQAIEVYIRCGKADEVKESYPSLSTYWHQRLTSPTSSHYTNLSQSP